MENNKTSAVRLDELPDYLNVGEVAAILRIPVKTVYLLIQRGEIPARKVGRQIRVSKAAFQAYMESPA